MAEYETWKFSLGNTAYQKEVCVPTCAEFAEFSGRNGWAQHV